MFIMMFISQMPSDAPTSFAALQWVTLVVMAAALAYVFRAWQADKKNCTDRYKNTIDRLLAALHKQLDEPEEVDITDIK